MPTSTSTSATPITSDTNANTLSSVVSNLVRASMGTSLSPTVTDEDLDRHVAELILREAKKKAEKYSQQGIRAYIASNLQDSNAPRANKRFLSSIIRSTDDHNKAILRAQAQAAEEIKRAKREQEKKERRARAEEAVRARREMEKSRQSSKPTFSSWRDSKVDAREEGWDRWNGRTADREKERQKRKVRSWETWNGDSESKDETEKGERRRREKGKDKERSRSRSKDRVDGDRHRRRRKVNEDDYQDNHERHRRPRTPPPRLRRDDEERRERNSHRRRRSRSRSPSKHRSKWKTSSSRHHRSRSSSPSTQGGRKRYDDDDNTFSDLPSEEGVVPRDSEHREPELREKLKLSRMKDDKPPSDAIPKISSLRDSTPSPPRSGHRYKSKSTKPSSRSSSHTPSTPLSPRSPSPHAPRLGSLSPSRVSSPSPGPSPPPDLPSKMDKYFEENYDPRLDVAPLNTKPNVPATGLIDNADFEGWDAMLELIRLRKEDKEERKRLERLGLLDKKSKKGKSKDLVGASTTGTGSSSLLNIEYKKRGSVREWDLGKEGVDLSF